MTRSGTKSGTSFGSRLGRSMREHPGRWALFIILSTFLLRLWFVATGQLNLVQDEAQYWDWSRHLQWTYYSKGPLIAWIIGLWTAVLGNTELGVRFGSIFGSVLIQIVLFWWIARVWERPRLGVLVLVVYNTIIVFASQAILMTTDNPLTLFWLLSMVCLDLASRHRDDGRVRPWPLLLMAPFIGLGILAKYAMVMFLPLALLYWYGLRRKGLAPRGFLPWLLVGLLLGLGLGFLPPLIWNMQHDFVGYKHVMTLIGASGDKATRILDLKRFPEYLGSQVGIATPWWLALMLLGGWRAMRRFWATTPTPDPALPTGAIIDKDDLGPRRNLLLALFFGLVWVVLLLWSLHAKVLPNWSTVTYVAGVILAGVALERLLFHTSRTWLKWLVLAPAILLFLTAHVFQYAPVPKELNITHRVKGWRDLGRTVENLRTDASLFDDPDQVFIFSNLYDMTAALAFYVPGQPRVYCGWVDSRRMNQYDLWPGPTDKLGWDAVYVLKGHWDAYPPSNEVQKMFDSYGEPIYLTTEFNGVPARKFTLIPCYGFNGYWPSRMDLNKF